MAVSSRSRRRLAQPACNFGFAGEETLIPKGGLCRAAGHSVIVPQACRGFESQRQAQLEQSRTALVRVGSVFAALFGLALDADRKL
jgi:hypothetical protein